MLPRPGLYGVLYHHLTLRENGKTNCFWINKRLKRSHITLFTLPFYEGP